MADPCPIWCFGTVYVEPFCSNNRESLDWLNRHYHKLANFFSGFYIEFSFIIQKSIKNSSRNVEGFKNITD